MKHFLATCLFIAGTASLFAQNYKIDTTVNETWTNNAWQLASRTINTYNSSCQLLSTTFQNRVGADWVNQLLFNYTYTGGDNVSESTIQNWNPINNTWVNFGRTTNTYNGSNLVTSTVSDTWTGIAWQNASRQTNNYDANGYLVSTLNELSPSGVWVNDSRETYTNNPDGTVNQQVTETWDVPTAAFVNETRINYIYDANKMVTESTSATWNGTAWVNAERDTFTYDAQGRELTHLVENWNTNAWINETLTTSTFNTGGQLTTILNQSWNTGTNAWQNVFQGNYVYSVNGSLFQTVIQTVPQGSTTLVNAQRSTFHYTTECVLPLTLLDFTAALSGKDVVLKWTTTKEINTSYFAIESSSDANNFQKIGSVKSANNLAQTAYQFTDANPAGLATGKLFYRIRMVDIDGKFSYSKIAYVGLPLNVKGFSIFPTTVQNNLFLMFKSESSTKAGIRIIDGLGRQVYNQELNLQQSINQYNINVSTLTKGVYYLQLITKEGANTAKFIKN